jgi:hypothetical protein
MQHVHAAEPGADDHGVHLVRHRSAFGIGRLGHENSFDDAVVDNGYRCRGICQPVSSFSDPAVLAVCGIMIPQPKTP